MLKYSKKEEILEVIIDIKRNIKQTIFPEGCVSIQIIKTVAFSCNISVMLFGLDSLESLMTKIICYIREIARNNTELLYW